MKQYRTYQQEADDIIFDKLSKGIFRQIVAICVGGGKTLLASRVANRFSKILFLAPTEELISQSGVALLNEFYPEIDTDEINNQYGDIIEYCRFLEKQGMFASEERKKFGIIKADLFSIDSKITIGSYQTIWRRLDRIPADFYDLIIVDECHGASAKQISKALNYFQPKLMLGISATPVRNDGANLSDIFQEIVYQYNMADAIQDGYLCELDCLQIKTQISLDNVHTVAGDFNQKELKETVDTPERNKLLVEKYKQYAEGKKNLVFCVDVEHAINVCQEFKNAGYRAEFIVGDAELIKDRKGIIERFRTGETQILTNCMILTAGYNNPSIECLTLAAPTKSLTKFIQQIGRGCRTLDGVIDRLDTVEERKAAIKASNKPFCTVLDIVDNTQKNRVINTWTLDSGKKIEDRVFITSEKKKKLIAERKKREFDALTKQDKRVNLFKLPEIKQSTSWKMNEPATQPQLDALKRAGYDTVNNTYTKGSASEIISNFPAREKWVSFLKFKNYDVSKGVTYSEALKAFKDIEEREKKAKIKEQAKEISNNLNITDIL